jgi:2-iminobutanoate/2-iminopropanoate deaminase
MKRTVMAEKGAKPAGPYSHAVVANGLVFVSGQGPADPETGEVPEDFKGQARQMFRNVQVILEAAGASMDDVVKVNAYVADMANFAQFNEVYEEFFTGELPARTTISATLPGGIPVEADCIAALPGS